MWNRDRSRKGSCFLQAKCLTSGAQLGEAVLTERHLCCGYGAFRGGDRGRKDRGANDLLLKRARRADAGQDVAGLETFWIQLLREYEAVCCELAGEHVISPAATLSSSNSGDPMTQGGLL